LGGRATKGRQDVEQCHDPNVRPAGPGAAFFTIP